MRPKVDQTLQKKKKRGRINDLGRRAIQPIQMKKREKR